MSSSSALSTFLGIHYDSRNVASNEWTQKNYKKEIKTWRRIAWGWALGWGGRSCLTLRLPSGLKKGEHQDSRLDFYACVPQVVFSPLNFNFNSLAPAGRAHSSPANCLPAMLASCQQLCLWKEGSPGFPKQATEYHSFKLSW